MTRNDNHGADMLGDRTDSVAYDSLLEELPARSNGHTQVAPLGQLSQRVGDRLALPEDFWSEREYLSHIRQAARARRVVPDALLCGVLARVCLLTPHYVVLPPLTGDVASLNSIFAVLGASGAGKDAALDLAAKVIPFRDPFNLRYVPREESLPPGSGEGIAHTFYGMVPSGDDKPVFGRAFDGVCIRINEGQMLEALAKRNGQITMPTLRQGWNGQTIGGSYSTKDKKVIVQANTYRLVVVMGVQPEYAEFVLKDHAGGTPQRFVWFQGALDSKAPAIAPEWPGELLTWEPRTREQVLSVSEAIRAKVDADRLRSLNTGGREVGQYDGQRNLLQLKIAALLSLLEPEQSVVLNGVDIDDDDWQIAGTILQVSDSVRAVAQTRILDHKESQYAESDARAGIRARTTLRATDDVKRVARTIARVVNIRCGYGDSLPYRDLHNAVSSRDRKVRNLLRDAISHACAERLITEIEGENDERRYEPCDGWNPDL